MKNSVYKSYDELPLFLNADTVAKTLGIAISSCYELLKEKDFPSITMLTEMEKHGTCEYVFPSPNGGPISPDSVLNVLHRVLDRAGLPSIRFHDLRHTFATLALQNGVDIKTASGMLGHFSASFTLDTYAHVTTEAQKEAANTMCNVLNVQ